MIREAIKFFVITDFIHQLLIIVRHHYWNKIAFVARNLGKFRRETKTMPRC
jgi:hypothetical protein